MADISDVMQVLATFIAGIAYPNGTSGPSFFGVPVQVSQGWPLASTIDAICAKPGVTAASPFTLVSIYEVPGTSGDGGTVLDFQPDIVSAMVPGITVTIDSTETIVQFAGIAVGGEVATLLVDGKVYSTACQPNDTAEVLASALAREANADYPQAAWWPGTSSIVLAGVSSLEAKVGITATLGLKVHRQHVQIRVVVWSSNPLDRSAVAASIDVAVKSKIQFAMPDTSVANIVYQGTNLDDGMERAGLYRRDLIYTALYDTIDEFQGIEITSVGLTSSLG